jgi:hypothetical protein
VDSSGLQWKAAVSYSKNGNALVTVVSCKSKVRFFPFAVQKRERTGADCEIYIEERTKDKHNGEVRNLKRKVGRGRKTVTQSVTGICLLDVLM